ncbi:unnamed protein product [Symbiodinium natans]|uniref:Uncharacterized protein n=1 Tax=Symbiodinium natans TaxID=878477 RepID=A0A812PEQ4_9DINO|nr:unnamed protein product [Symbiodinium natans]
MDLASMGVYCRGGESSAASLASFSEGQQSPLLAAIRREVEAVEDRLLVRITRLERQSFDATAVLEKVAPNELKLLEVESRQRESERTLAQLDGLVRGVNEELQSMVKRTAAAPRQWPGPTRIMSISLGVSFMQWPGPTRIMSISLGVSFMQWPGPTRIMSISLGVSFMQWPGPTRIMSISLGASFMQWPGPTRIMSISLGVSFMQWPGPTRIMSISLGVSCNGQDDSTGPRNAMTFNKRLRICLLFASTLGLAHAHCLYDNKPTLEKCVRKCRHSPTAGCVSGCVAGYPYFVRPSCAACLGNGVVCAFRSCRTQCASSINAPGCTTCITSSCGTCSGAYKAGNFTEMAELAALSMDLQPQAQEQPEEVQHKAETETETATETETETEVAPASSKSKGCWEDQASLKYCGTKCFGAPNKRTCATNCLRNERGMSQHCAACFGDKVACTIKKCLAECMADGNSNRCKTCVRGKCGRCDSAKSSSDAEEDAFLSAVIATALPAGAEQAAIYP